MIRTSLLFLLFAGILSATPTDNLASYWKFENNLDDSAAVGTANTGSWTGGSSFTGSGFFGSAADVSPSSYINVPNSADFNGASQSLSVSVWFTIPSFSPGWQGLVAMGEGSQWRIARNSGGSNMSYAGGTGDISGGPNVNDGNWHHLVAVTEHGVSTRLFVDGVIADIGGSPSVTTSTNDMAIGNNPERLERAWDGLIDDLGIFNTALTNEQAIAIHTLATNPDYLYDLGQTNELLQLITCPLGTTTSIDNTTWEVVDSNPNDGRDFIELSPSIGVAGSVGPVINSFTVDHPTIPSGFPVTFDWDLSPAATSITIDQGVGNVLPNTTAGVGSITINPGPSTTTDYTISATDANGTSTRTLTVTVTDQPIIETFSVNPAVVTPGESVTVTWSTLNSSTTTLNGTPIAASGSSVFTPASSTNYTLAVSNGNGSASKTLAVSVVIPGEPIISEFLASNNGSLLDEDGDESDWIQLTNYSGDPTIINGTNRYYLTDSPSNLTKWEIPDQNIAPGASILVFASQKDRASPQMHTNFSLSNDGEYLALVKVVGGATTILSEFNDYPRQFDDISYGVLTSDLGDYRYFATPSPTADNSGTSYADYVRDTSFSIGRGFYNTPQSVAIASNTVDAQIYYTLDGSEPAAGVGTLYTSPISISSTTVLRAIATKVDFLPTNIDTNTYIFRSDIVSQSSTPMIWPASSPNGQTLEYAMDTPASVGTTTQGMIDALGAIPSISIVTDQDNLTDSSTGIYVNAGQRGIAWERKSSIELIHAPEYLDPDGNTEGFQSEFGLRIRGGFSRSNGNPKHAFRLFFRRTYGDRALNYPLFGPEGANTFKGFDLRTSQNYSWAFQNNDNNTFMREVFARDTQRDMGQPHTRSRYYHLYLNGVYWGLYMSQERAEAEYAEEYFGGSDLEYDTLKSAGSSGGYNTETTDGNSLDWESAYAIAQNINSTTSGVDNYLHIQGLDATGTRDPARPVHINMEQLISYMLVVFYNGSFDAPLSTFIGASNNWFALRNRVSDDMGWAFFAHDMEHSLGTNSNSNDRTGPFAFVNENFSKSNPQYFHQYLSNHPEYRLKFADLAHKAFFNDGVYTNNSVLARFGEREAIVTQVIDAEAARWGDGRNRTTWNNAVTSMENWTNNRNLTVLSQLEADGHYPSTDAPSYNQHGGQVSQGFNLIITNPNGSGTIHYTTDGSDPRLYGGAVSGSASSGNSFTINTSQTVNARVLLGGVWSALHSATFVIGTTPGIGDLVISEINYHPSDPTASEISAGFTDDDDFEFIEITNVSAGPIDLTEVSIGGEAIFAFGGGVIAAGESIVVVRNTGGFTQRHPGISHLGPYTGKLNNAGATLQLLLNGTTVLYSVTYGDDLPWPTGADGGGYSIVLTDPDATPNDGNSWRISTELGGNPTTSDSDPFTGVATDDDNGNGIANLIEALLRDGGGTYFPPVIATTNIDAVDYLTLTLRRAVAVDNAHLEIQDSSTLQTWSLAGNELLSSTPQGDGTVVEVYRLIIPIVNADMGFLRVKISTN